MMQFLFGACLGAGAALLFAPMTGQSARSRLLDQVAKSGHEARKLRELAEKKQKHFSNKMIGYKHKMNEVKEDVIKKIDAVQTTIVDKMDELKQKDMESTSNLPYSSPSTSYGA